MTDPGMTRFIMSVEEAVKLVIDSASYARGGEVFITKMPVVSILDLAEVMIQELAPLYNHRPDAVQIENIGVKPGEKMYEELMNLEETRRAWELTHYFVVLPAFTSLYRFIDYEYSDVVSRTVTNPYHSGNETKLSKAQLAEFLRENNLLEDYPGDKQH